MTRYGVAIEYDDVMAVLREIVDDLQDDLELDEVDLTPGTRLVDLGMESISLVYLVSELQQNYRQGDGVFRRLRAEGRLLAGMTVGDIVQSVVGVGACDNGVS